LTTHTLPLLPLKDVAVFPHLIQALIVGRPASLAAVKAAIDGDREILTVLQRDPGDEQPGRDGLHDVGTVSTVKRVEKRENGAQVIVGGQRRVRLHSLSSAGGAAFVEVEYLPSLTVPEAGESRAKALALMRENLDIARQIAHIMSQNPDQLFQQMVRGIDDPITQMYRLAALLRNADQSEKQKVLEIDGVQPLLEAVHGLLRQELAVSRCSASCSRRPAKRLNRTSASTCCGTRSASSRKPWARTATTRMSPNCASSSSRVMAGASSAAADRPKTMRTQAKTDLRCIMRCSLLSPAVRGCAWR